MTRLLVSTLSRRVRRLEDSGMKELVAAQEAVILSLAKLAECRDPETRAHLDRISSFCSMLARASAAVLLPPRRLPAEETRVMRRHPRIGATAIRRAMDKSPSVSFLAMGYDIALFHHEWVNGGGYPRASSARPSP